MSICFGVSPVRLANSFLSSLLGVCFSGWAKNQSRKLTIFWKKCQRTTVIDGEEQANLIEDWLAFTLRCMKTFNVLTCHIDDGIMHIVQCRADSSLYSGCDSIPPRKEDFCAILMSAPPELVQFFVSLGPIIIDVPHINSVEFCGCFFADSCFDKCFTKWSW